MIIDTANPGAPEKRPIKADSAIMNPVSKVIALKASVPGVEGDNLQIFNLATKAKLKSVQFPQAVVFWKWISASKLGLVTATSVYHWDVEVRRGRQACGCRVVGRRWKGTWVADRWLWLWRKWVGWLGGLVGLLGGWH